MTDFYGLKPMSFEEEVNAPESVKEKRRCKIEIQDMCSLMARDLETIAYTARNIPEEDDAAHAELVKQYRDAVKAAQAAIDRVIFMRFRED